MSDLAMKELFERAHSFANQKHAGQLRKDGKPYITHPEAVAATFDYSPEKVVAVLHDVLEDTDATEEELRSLGVTEDMLVALRLLKHQPGIPYMDYVKAVVENPIAKAVKLADLRHNLSTIEAIRHLPCAKELEERYQKALQFLGYSMEDINDLRNSE